MGHAGAEDPVAFASTEHERLIAALKASRTGTWRWSIAADIVEWDEALCEVYGIAPDLAPKNAAGFLALIHPEDRERAWSSIRACIEEGIDADYQFRTIVNGEIRWIYDRSALVRDPAGNAAYMLGACLDVTEHRRVQEERDAALEKQTVLLRELSHRVKNHLAMVSALLNLKASRQTDPAARADFHRAIERINTIAYLHERLYRAGDVERVDMQDYLADICGNLSESLLEERGIKLQSEIQAFALHIDKAVPVGLIVNELITNAAKYAFPGRNDGTITVRLRTRGQRATLTISDNGRGLEPGAAPGVGSRLVKSLAAQIGARLRIVSGRGVTCSLTFSG
jgi:PAS domain S-box-containing protein